MTPLKTRFSREAEAWYNKWLEQETYQVEPPEVQITRIPIVGMKHHGISEDLKLDGPLVLEHEPDNKYDPRAVKVTYNGTHIGYIPRKSAALFHQNEFHQEGEDLTILPKAISGTELFVYLVGC